MTPDQVQLLRRLALNEPEATRSVMSGQPLRSMQIDDRLSSLIRLVALVCVDCDQSTLDWATTEALAAGVDDDMTFSAIIVIAPIIGVARLSSVLPRLMSSLDLEIVDV